MMLEEHRIGIKLKHARMVKGLRLRDVAERADCSESLISKIENGRANPSVSMLHRIASVLGTNIGHLFAMPDEDGGLVQRQEERPIIATDSLRRGQGITLERLVPNVEGSLLQGAIQIIEPGGGSNEKISHVGEEVGYVLDGWMAPKREFC
jgi:transcriptional regulator with XRE-family HTH domain